ncbi:MAG: DUF2508 family protein [Firmicutes bacterium]|nr:DUF2508 family protein [Bacillota bacterium]
MLERVAELFIKISAYFFPLDDDVPLQQSQDYFFLVEQARREWQSARKRFNEISDPDLVDHAVYNIEAAERRYIYLLKKAKEEGATLYSASDERLGRWQK